MIVLDEIMVQNALAKIEQSAGKRPVVDFAKTGLTVTFIAKELDPRLSFLIAQGWQLGVKPAEHMLAVTYALPYALIRYTGPASQTPVSTPGQTELPRALQDAAAIHAPKERHYRKGLPIDKCPVTACGKPGKIYVQTKHGKEIAFIEHNDGSKHFINEHLQKMGKTVDDLKRIMDTRQKKVENSPSAGRGGIGIIEDMNKEERTPVMVRGD